MAKNKYSKCMIKNCVSNLNKIVDRSFYYLPINEERRNTWLKALNIDITSLTKKRY